MTERKAGGPFVKDTLVFLKQLARNNNRPWFETQKARYEVVVKEASLRFLRDIGPKLTTISSHLVADPRPVGGSMMRIYRDIRFAKDKSPYRTAIGIHVFHDAAPREEHFPSFFLHIGPGESRLYSGIWHPEPSAAAAIRRAIATDPPAWKRAIHGLELEGESYQRPPPGVDPAHPLLVDLKRKDFVASAGFADSLVTGNRFESAFLHACRRLAPLNRFVAKSLKIPW